MLAAAAKHVASDLPKLGKFVPFDRATKMSQATAVNTNGVALRAIKVAFTAVVGIAQAPPDASPRADQLEARGYRVLAVAVGPPEALKVAGLIALSDPPRPDSAALIAELHTLGVRTVRSTATVCPRSKRSPTSSSVHPQLIESKAQQGFRDLRQDRLAFYAN